MSENCAAEIVDFVDFQLAGRLVDDGTHFGPAAEEKRPHAASVKLANEAVYQAWKISSMGFLPALLCGRRVVDAATDSCRC